jgi:hypothetical protein
MAFAIMVVVGMRIRRRGVWDLRRCEFDPQPREVRLAIVVVRQVVEVDEDRLGPEHAVMMDPGDLARLVPNLKQPESLQTQPSSNDVTADFYQGQPLDMLC